MQLKTVSAFSGTLPLCKKKKKKVVPKRCMDGFTGRKSLKLCGGRFVLSVALWLTGNRSKVGAPPGANFTASLLSREDAVKMASSKREGHFQQLLNNSNYFGGGKRVN